MFPPEPLKFDHKMLCCQIKEETLWRQQIGDTFQCRDSGFICLFYFESFGTLIDVNHQTEVNNMFDQYLI